MPSTPARFRRFLWAAPLALGVALLGGSCPDEVEQEPEVAAVRLTVGTQTVEVSDNGTVTPAAGITINATTNLSATFLRADGSTETLVTDAEFELRVTSQSTGVVTFTRTGPFAGTLNKLSTGPTQLSVELFHLVEQHPDFGPFPVPITVN
ncbi:MAG TPA: hypothetical protein VD793_02370 [Gemmatimonadales bacterium]|nr:hypothetical protein [Gemmatimonadales bacterium]